MVTLETGERKWKKKIREEKEINDRLIKDKMIRDMRTLFEQEHDDDYFKPKTVSNFWNNNYIEYKSKADRNKSLSLDQYLNKLNLTGGIL